MRHRENAGFWVRFGALNITTIWFCFRFRTSPVKMAMKLDVLDAITGDTITIGQSVAR